MEGKPRKAFFDNLYSNPFQSPRANPKHSGHQVNGETMQSQTQIKQQLFKKNNA
ncbi:YpzG family protein [Bacillaceae bacterium S4-13-58]